MGANPTCVARFVGTNTYQSPSWLAQWRPTPSKIFVGPTMPSYNKCFVYTTNVIASMDTMLSSRSFVTKCAMECYMFEP
jgi:hypothetical protein